MSHENPYNPGDDDQSPRAYPPPQWGRRSNDSMLPPYNTHNNNNPPEQGLPPAGCAVPPHNAVASNTPPLARWGARAQGYALDSAIVAAPTYLLGAVTGAMNNGAGDVLDLVGLILILVFGCWNRWFRSGRTGQSIGRRQAGTKLISEATGEPIGAANAFMRDVAHLLDTFSCYLGWLFPLWDPRRQTFADKVMKTVVVTVPKDSRQ